MRPVKTALLALALCAVPAVSPAWADAPFYAGGKGPMKVDRVFPVWSSDDAKGTMKSGSAALGSGAVSFNLSDDLSGIASKSVSVKCKKPSSPAWSGWEEMVSASPSSECRAILTAENPTSSGYSWGWTAPGGMDNLFSLNACDAAGNCIVNGQGAGVSGVSMIKVVGVISSKSVTAEAGALVVSNVSKFAAKTAIRQRAQEVLRSSPDLNARSEPVIDFDTVSAGGGKLLSAGTIRAFSGSVTVGNGSAVSVLKRGTFLVSGGDVTINENVVSERPFAIVALADSLGKNGGYIRIGSGVTNVDAVLFADRAVIGDGGPNQLYVRGSILSENTIGGAKWASAPRCPFFAKPCDLETAGKFDLNVLRDYHLEISTGSVYYPAENGKVAGAGTCSFTGADCSFPSLGPARLFKNAHDSATASGGEGPNLYARYSLVVKHNSATLSNPPPLFGK